MEATELNEYGAKNLLLPPMVEQLQTPSTPVRVSAPIDEAPEKPRTGNVIEPLVKNYVPRQVNHLITFARYILTQSDFLIIFN
jgi:hypothetical protein